MLAITCKNDFFNYIEIKFVEATRHIDIFPNVSNLNTRNI